MEVNYAFFVAVGFSHLLLSCVPLRAADSQIRALQQSTLYSHVANHQQVLPDGIAALVVPAQPTTWSPVYAGIIYSVSRVDAGKDTLDFVLGTNLKVRNTEAFKGDLADQTTIGVYPSIANSVFINDVLYIDVDLANSTFVTLAPGQTKEVTVYTYLGHPDK